MAYTGVPAQRLVEELHSDGSQVPARWHAIPVRLSTPSQQVFQEKMKANWLRLLKQAQKPNAFFRSTTGKYLPVGNQSIIGMLALTGIPSALGLQQSTVRSHLFRVGLRTVEIEPLGGEAVGIIILL